MLFVWRVKIGGKGFRGEVGGRETILEKVFLKVEIFDKKKTSVMII